MPNYDPARLRAARTVAELARMARQWAEVVQAAMTSRQLRWPAGSPLDAAWRQLRALDPAADRSRAAFVLHPTTWADLLTEGGRDQLVALAVVPGPSPGQVGSLFGVPVRLEPGHEGPPLLVPPPEPWLPAAVWEAVSAGVVDRVQAVYDRVRWHQSQRVHPFVASEWCWRLGTATWGQVWAVVRASDDQHDPPPPEAALGGRLLGIPMVVAETADPDTLVLEPALPESIAQLPTPVRTRAIEAAEQLANWWGWSLPQGLRLLGEAIASGRPGIRHAAQPLMLAGLEEATPDLEYLRIERQHSAEGHRRLVITGRDGRVLVLGLPPVEGSPAAGHWDCDELGHLYVFAQPGCQACGEPRPANGYARVDGPGWTTAAWTPRNDVEAPADIEALADPTSEEYLAQLDRLYNPEEDRRRLAAVDQLLDDRQEWESAEWESASWADRHTMTLSGQPGPSCPTGAHAGRCCAACDHDLDGYDCTCLED